MLVSALGMTKQRTAPSLGEARKMKEVVGFGFAFFFFSFKSKQTISVTGVFFPGQIALAGSAGNAF